MHSLSLSLWLLVIVVFCPPHTHAADVVAIDAEASMRFHDTAKAIVVEAEGNGPRADLVTHARTKLAKFKSLLRSSRGALPVPALRQLLVEAIGADPQLGEAHGFLGLLSRNEMFDDHREYFLRVMQPFLTALALQHALPIGRIDPAILLHQLATKQPLPDTPFDLIVFPHRLRHDVEHAQYLAQRQLIPATLALDLQLRYESVLSELDALQVPHTAPYLLTVAQWTGSCDVRVSLFSFSFSKATHLRAPKQPLRPTICACCICQWRRQSWPVRSMRLWISLHWSMRIGMRRRILLLWTIFCRRLRCRGCWSMRARPRFWGSDPHLWPVT